MTPIDEHILIQYLDGTLSNEGKAEVESWLAASEDNEKQLEQLYFMLQVTSRLRVMKAVDPDAALLRFKSRIQKQNGRSVVRHQLQLLQQIAAILFIPLFLLSIYLLSSHTEEKERMLEVRSNPGVVSKFNLPDGTRVWLNAGSTLRYPSEFQRDFRTVELNGQGYFEVTKHADQPFIVKTNEVYSVEVLGTSFGVLAYEDEDLIETTLVEGSVKLNLLAVNGKRISQILKPNEKAEFKKGTNQLEITTVDTDYDTAWKRGEIIFRNHPMSQVLKILSRHYHVTFEVKDQEVMKSILTAKFKDEQLPQVMEYIRLASGIHYTIRKPSISSGQTLNASIIEISK
ncbi:MAG: DUF4974 domain-containing protein [Tannerellaceae bacterium]